MLLHHSAPRAARSSGVARCAAAPAQTLRDERATSARLAAVLLAALRARSAAGFVGATGAREVRSALLSMEILLRRPDGPRRRVRLLLDANPKWCRPHVATPSQVLYS